MSPHPYGNEMFAYVVSTAPDSGNDCNVDVEYYVEINNPDNPPPITVTVAFTAQDADGNALSCPAPFPVTVSEQIGTSKRWRSQLQIVEIDCSNAETEQCSLQISCSDAEGDTPQPCGPESPYSFDCPCAGEGYSAPAKSGCSSSEVEIIIRVKGCRPKISTGRPRRGRPPRIAQSTPSESQDRGKSERKQQGAEGPKQRPK
jgi:hypothetical protein